MGGSYRQCPECGKRALSIASRCPSCLREFPAREEPEAGPVREPGRLPWPRVAAGVLAAAAIVALATIAPTDRPAAPPSLSTSASGSTAAPSEVGYARVAHASEPARAGAPPADIPRVLVARSWTSVRKARSKGAELEAVLLPGDTVVADSLGHGWYRVALEGEVLGYAHRSTLTSPVPPAPPSLP